MSQRFRAAIRVRFKSGVLDPQAEAIFKVLHAKTEGRVESVECERLFVLSLSADSEQEAQQTAKKLGQDYLTNLVMEEFEVMVSPAT